MLDPADVFLQVYEELRDNEGQTRLLRAKAVQAAKRSDNSVLKVANSAFGPSFESVVTEVKKERNGPWIIALGLDQAFGDLLYEKAKGKYKDYFLQRLERTGCLSDAGTPAILLPRRGHLVDSVPLDHFGETFMNVTVVDGSQANRLRVHAVGPLEDIHLGPRENLKIACVPFLEDMDELDWRYREEAGYHWYQVSPRSALGAEVPRLLKELDTSGAHIAVLPESTLSDEILEAWRVAILDRRRPKKSKLRWILAGSGPVALGDDDGPDQQANRAVLLSRDSGEVMLTHDKISPFTILPEDLDRFNLHKDFGKDLPGRPLHEWMAEGSATNILSSQIGGVAVAICEDLDRVEDHLARMISARPSYVIVPVLSNYLVEERACDDCGAPAPDFWKWEAQRASVYAHKIGCRVVVCTSLAFPKRSGVESCATSLVMSPSPVSRWVATDWGQTTDGGARTPNVHIIKPPKRSAA